MFFSLPDTLFVQVLDYAIPLVPEIRQEFADVSLYSFSYNPMAFFYFKHHQLPLSQLSTSLLSEQTNDEIVSYLVEHSTFIDMDVFCKNPHPKAVHYMMTIGRAYLHWSFLSQNTNDDVIRYLLDHPRMINWREFSANPNDIAVTYLLEHSKHIYWEAFSQNTNTKAIAYLLDHPQYITWKYFCKHNDDRVANYLLEHTSLLHTLLHFVSENPHDDIVMYVLEHNCMALYPFSRNTNPRAVEWLLQHSNVMPPEIYQHPDVRIFTNLLSTNLSNRTKLVHHPHVFYYTKHTQEYEWYQAILS